VNLKLSKPLAIVDLETTGLRVESDRIVEISVLLFGAEGARVSKTRRVNPGIPIPPEATAVHGIRDEDVAGEPRFEQIAASLLEFLGDADLAGYNVRGFDLPLLAREFERAGRTLSLEGRAIIDAMEIFKRREPRNLAAAYLFYCGKRREGLHTADADVQACAEILEAQLARYDDLPREPAAIDGLFRPPWIDREGKFAWRGGEAVLNFGRRRGQTMRSVAEEDPSYFEWMARADFPEDAREIARRALDGEFPERRDAADGEGS
jgi:DNA polymerase-3 subunit epsilon